MPNLKDIRKRIGSVKNTQKITKAMKMVAAAKLRRAQDRMQAARPYARKMGQVISGLTARVGADAHPLLQVPEERKKLLVVVVTSNRGLCGGFNTNLTRAVDRFIHERQTFGEEVELVTVGRKGSVYYQRTKRAPIHKDFPDIIGQVDFRKAKALAEYLMARFLGGEYQAVYLAFNQFVSAIAYNSLVQPVLPLTMDAVEAATPEEVAASGDYIFEPDVKTLLGRMLPSHVEVQVMQALFDSEASEHSARMTAMDSATNNASDMINRLTLQYNRARQAYITKEIVEIVSGAESLKG